MKFKVALTIIAASFIMVPSAFADVLSFGSTSDSFSGNEDGGVTLYGAPSCSIDQKASFDFKAAVKECSCFLNQSVAFGDYTSFYSYLYDNVSQTVYSDGVVWADHWGYWGFSVVTNGEFSADEACSRILQNRPHNKNNCYTRCRR
jgi:hypothetical protein